MSLHPAISEEHPYNWRSIEKAVGLFHASGKFLGDRFVLTPRIPAAPYEDMWPHVIEDTITPRVSLAPTLYRAFKALGEEPGGGGYVSWNWFVYGVDNDIDVVVPFGKPRPRSPGNPYGPNFSFQEYLEYLDSKGHRRPGKRQTRNLFKNLVPDAKITGEVWSLNPTPVVLLGRVVDNKFYLANWIIDRVAKKQSMTSNMKPIEMVDLALD